MCAVLQAALSLSAHCPHCRGSLRRQGSLRCVHGSCCQHSAITQYAALQIYPRNSTNAPRLLTQLNELLASKQREAEKAACSLGPSQRCQAAAANLQLEVHRQLFDAFIAGFASYSPLLLQIKVGRQQTCVTIPTMLRP